MRDRGEEVITYRTLSIKYYTENDPDGEKDDERPPPAEAGAAPVGERPHDGREEEAYQGREAPDHRHVLVPDPWNRNCSKYKFGLNLVSFTGVPSSPMTTFTPDSALPVIESM